MSKEEFDQNIQRLNSKIKAFSNTAISYFSQKIETAIQYDEFFQIDYDKYASVIIERANISENRKEEIRQMFKNYKPKAPEEEPTINKLQFC